MEQVGAIVQLAEQRAQHLGLPYRGALLPSEAYYLMQHLPGALLVDVRTAAEWQFVGVVPKALCIEWRMFPGMQLNDGFVETLQQHAAPDTPLMFLCRSGVRSDEAARVALEAGYRDVFNVLEGFEGDKDAASQRGHLNGWMARGLPWVQG
jgi:rhodanese-related sulfurtransferase